MGGGYGGSPGINEGNGNAAGTVIKPRFICVKNTVAVVILPNGPVNSGIDDVAKVDINNICSFGLDDGSRFSQNAGI